MSIQDHLDKKYEEYYLENKSTYEKYLLLIKKNVIQYENPKNLFLKD